MFKSSATKFFFVFPAIFAVSCAFWRASDAPASNSPGASAVSEIKSEIPFATVEPQIYQVEVTITSGGTDRKIFIARNGERRATVYNPGDENAVTRLDYANGATFTVYNAGKTYVETAPGENADEAGANDFLTTERLNQKTAARFENLGAENGLTKFRARLGDGESANSEVLMFYDENLKMIVRQEFYAGDGERKTLTYSIELKNFKTEPDAHFFELPKDYRRVSSREFWEIVRREKSKGN